ncbi:MAG TPA: DNA polymerase IV [Alphaproteobacteria bacterium]|nr:DNA polymerase IV [Alphaproteobacteria bacterium]
MTARCRGCGNLATPEPNWRCPRCGERRSIAHGELDLLSIAHIDCDAFYAAIEKRDDPGLRRKPVIVGGSHRGVVAACCYVARLSGVRSAMPMFRALKLCPDAVVIQPNMAKYRSVGEEVRRLMLMATPLVEPLSIDEAFLDLTAPAETHGDPPAAILIRLAHRIEKEIGITVSIGLAGNKFLAKIASDLDKPRGFAVIGRSEARRFLAPRPVGLIFGVGEAMRRQLAARGILTIGQLQQMSEQALGAEFGELGRRLYRFARGEDERKVEPNAPTKSISAETTFDEDLSAKESLLAELWPLAQTVSRRLKRAELAAQSVAVKLKTTEFRLLTRHRRLGDPTQLAEILYQAAKPLVEREADGRAFRLIGIGAEALVEGMLADPPDLLAAQPMREIDSVDTKLGTECPARDRNSRPRGVG